MPSITFAVQGKPRKRACRTKSWNSILHFIPSIKPNWGKSTEIIGLVEKARQEGIDVTVDQYPYVASSTTLDTTVPTWVFSGGRDSWKLRINDPIMRQRIKQEMVDSAAAVAARV